MSLPSWMRWLVLIPPVRWWKERHVVRAHERRAEAELATSKKLLAEDRREFVYPLATEHQRNRFSDMIRDALEAGYDVPPAPRQQENEWNERKK